MLVIHHNDLDGRSSAAILRHAHGYMPVKFREMDYKDPVPLDDILEDEIVFIVDFSFKPDDMAKILERTKKVTWIDHDATAAEYDYGTPLPGLRNFKNKDEAGCELTWRFCYPNTKMPDAIRYLGDYDKFALTYPESTTFYEGMKTVDHEVTNDIWKKLLDDGPPSRKLVRDILAAGETAIAYRDAYCKEMVDAFGYETDFDGLKCFAANLYRFGSKGFGDKMNQYDACIAYVYDGAKYTVSMYADNDHTDVSKTCKKHGGGGHMGASGFTCNELPFKPKSQDVKEEE